MSINEYSVWQTKHDLLQCINITEINHLSKLNS